MTRSSSYNLRVRAALFAVIAPLAAQGCVVKHDGPRESDTTTNWLHACKRNSDCRGETSCLSGRCSVTCSPRVESACLALSVEAECQAEEAAPAHCDLPCGSELVCQGLGSDYACNAGLCRPQIEGTVQESEPSHGMDAGPVVIPPFADDTRPDSGPQNIFPIFVGDTGVDAGDAGYVCPNWDASYASPSWQPPPWETFVSDAGRDELFKAVRETFVGRWHGLATPPSQKSYLVDLEFEADGHYSGRCSELIDPCCTALSAGTDRETKLKQYTLLDVQASGYVIGDIDIVYYNDFDGSYWASSQGKLSYVERDRSGNGLRLRVANEDGVGPIRFDLRRRTDQ